MNLETITLKEVMIILLLSLPFLLLVFRLISKHGRKELPLPPGPYPWPIVGNLFQIGKNNLHVSLAKMAQVHGPLMSLRLGQKIMIVGSSSVAASEILKTHDHALSGRDVSRLLQDRKPTVHNMNLLFTSECDDSWRNLRNIYKMDLLSGKALESRAHMREDKVMEMVKYLCSKEGEVIVIKDVMFAMVVNILGNASLSMDLVDFEGNGIGEGVMDAVERFIRLVAKPLLADLYPILSRWDLRGWYKQVMHIIEHELGSVWEDSLQKKRNQTYVSSSSPKDFLDILIEKGFTNRQINSLMEDVFAGGTKTTSLTTEWFIAALLKNEEVMQKARNEVLEQIHGNIVKESDLIRLPYLEACYKETLRLYPVGPLLVPHKATQTCEVMGYTVPKDSQILVNVWAIGHDPNIWDDPLSFKPERFIGSKLSYKGTDFGYLPFGSGRRMCPGESMASKMILLTVASLIKNFNWLLPNNMNPKEINMDEEMDLALHKKEPLHLVLKVSGQFKN